MYRPGQGQGVVQDQNHKARVRAITVKSRLVIDRGPQVYRIVPVSYTHLFYKAKVSAVLATVIISENRVRLREVVYDLSLIHI